MMQRYFLPLILYIVFLFEGTFVPLIIPTAWHTRVDVAPHFTFIIILFLAIYVSRHWALAYGLCFGMLHDIVYYGPMLGTYAFGMGLVAYLISLLSLRFKANLLMCILLILLGNFLFEVMIYGIYRIFQITHLTMESAILHRMLPSTLFNLLFALLVYMPIRKLLEMIEDSREREEEEQFH
jgi:rod shape-determining protein MreD